MQVSVIVYAWEVKDQAEDEDRGCESGELFMEIQLSIFLSWEFSFRVASTVKVRVVKRKGCFLKLFVFISKKS